MYVPTSPPMLTVSAMDMLDGSIGETNQPLMVFVLLVALSLQLVPVAPGIENLRVRSALATLVDFLDRNHTVSVAAPQLIVVQRRQIVMDQ